MLCHPVVADSAQLDVLASRGASPQLYRDDYEANDSDDPSQQLPHALLFG
jgi:hypothetical protein